MSVFHIPLDFFPMFFRPPKRTLIGILFLDRLELRGYFFNVFRLNAPIQGYMNIKRLLTYFLNALNNPCDVAAA